MTASRTGRIIASVILVATAAGAAVIVAVDASLPALSSQDPVEGWGFMVAFSACAVTGAAVLLRRPKHAIGWILAVVGLLPMVAVPLERWGTYVMLTRGEPDFGTQLGFWLNTWYWYVLIGLVLFYLPLLYPTGRLPTSRWRTAAFVPTLALATMVVLGVLQPTMGSQEDRSIVIPNPLGVAGTPHPEEGAVAAVLLGMLLFGMLLALVAVVVRFRRSSGVERQQMKWFFVPAAFLPLGMLEDLAPLPDVVLSLTMPLTVAAFPVAIGVAITRYRLYDLGRIVSRTVSYALVMLTLVAVYLGSVLALGAVARSLSGDANELVVAASTLVVAVLFQPVRGRVQAVVDRRFNRRRYDAAQEVERFGGRLRDSLALDDVISETVGVAVRTVQPAGVSVWLRQAGG